ncbi:hypothetical protein CHS0354_015523 [Potamilus streckersoni]|uniref:tRNA (guanine(26)-N(2))-dimethyltransferase n=1 Tax=Potamilus streckersoni TaxID=2493646 RepID=A0AAE0SFS3_9BIVA|nr:hypothetical protein CHS0354_015523 [Potamilus streckersoni]
MEEIINELNVTILANGSEALENKSKTYNAKMSTIREAVLCTLLVESKMRGKPISCLDALGGTGQGIVGLQLKKGLPTQAKVVISDRDSETVEVIRANCMRNDLTPNDLKLDFSRTPGDPQEDQGPQEIHVCHCSADVLLRMEAFEFVYLNPYGNYLCIYLDSLFCRLPNNGIACLVSADISPLFARSAPSVLRQYGAHVMKTDYMKEMAARVVIAAAARCASRYNKGIEVLYTVCSNDYFLIVLRVGRGQKHANISLNKVSYLLHCQMCEEREFYPETHTPIEEPYRFLQCDCYANTPGKTGMVLGPMWKGEIFNGEFLQRMLETSKEMSLSQGLKRLLALLLEESFFVDLHTESLRQDKDKKGSGQSCEVSEFSSKPEESFLLASSSSSNNHNTLIDNNNCKSVVHIPKEASQFSSANEERQSESGEPVTSNVDTATHTSQSLILASGKRSCGKLEGPQAKRIKYNWTQLGSGAPCFYYNLHRMKFKATQLPKSDKLVLLLRKHGFKASRTHFDQYAIRTNATLNEMYQIIKTAV